jgi:hypothetical protein
MSESVGSVRVGKGLRQRPTTTSPGSTVTLPADGAGDMAYSSLRNKSRPVLATAIARASAAAAAASSPNSRGGGIGNNSGGFMNNRDLRHYRDRIVILLFIAAVYTTYIYKSGMLPVERLLRRKRAKHFRIVSLKLARNAL